MQSPNVNPFRVLLGVSGGIAAYKACELVRLLRKSGCEVRVVMTKNAENFVGPLTFATLSGNTVLRSLANADHGLSPTAHIDLAAWADIFVVAPATGNILAKLALGIADDALSTEALAFTNPILVAPAMNTRMWEAVATQKNLEALRARGVIVIGPEAGDLACGEVGMGKMSEAEKIAAAVLERLRSGPLAGKKVLVTSGPTRSYIDSVRFISNRSSGRMGHALAEEAERLGAKVVLLTGPVEDRFATLRFGKVIRIETNAEMYEHAMREMQDADIIVGAAAVADFEVEQTATGKLERKGKVALELQATTDILGAIGKARKPGQVLLGFAAEAGDSEIELEKAKQKLLRKNIDIVALNNVARKDIGFDVDHNEMHVFVRKEPLEYFTMPYAPKHKIARDLLKLAAEQKP